jgi:serine/threonine-protein kinase
MDVRPGAVVASRYEIQAALGQGGMGAVYRAHDRLLDEAVAIKILRPELASDQDLARRFQSEIKLARRVSHRNVCRIHEYNEFEGLRYISMEFLEGVDLRTVLRQAGRGLPVDAAFDAALQVCEGLQAIHEVGIIHRDLKTPNIMRDKRGVLKLMDFGIAKEWGSDQSATATGIVLGTPEYMSPEQARGEKVDFRTDVYALGILVFEVFTGRVPFKADTPLGTILKHLQEAPPLDGPEAAGIPPGVREVLRRALAKQPADRFATVAEMAQALQLARAGATPVASIAAVAGGPAPATARLPLTVTPGSPTAPADAAPTLARPAPTRRAPPPPPSTAAAPASVPAPPRPVASRSQPWLWIGGLGTVLGVALLVVVVGFSMVQRRLGGGVEKPTPAPSARPTGPPGRAPGVLVARTEPATPAPAAVPATAPARPEPTRATSVPAAALPRPTRGAAAGTPLPSSALATAPRTLAPAPQTPPPTPAAPPPPAIPEAVQEQMAELKEGRGDERWKAAETLGKIGGEARAAVPALIEALSERNATLRWRSAEALGRIGDARAVAPLVAALSDRDGLVKTEAAKALGRLGPAAREAVPVLAQGLRDPDAFYRREAAKALARAVGPQSAEVVPPLIDALRDKDKFVRAESARALGKIGAAARAAVPALRNLTRENDVVVVGAAEEALRSIGG